MAATGVGVTCVVLLDGPLGWLAGIGAAVGAFRWLSSRPDERELEAGRRRRDELPVVVDLLAACFASGAPALTSLQLVAETSRSSIGVQLRQVAGALSMGASEEEAWLMLAGDDAAPIVETLCRTARSGTCAAEQLRAVSRDLRARARECHERCPQTRCPDRRTARALFPAGIRADWRRAARCFTRSEVDVSGLSADAAHVPSCCTQTESTPRSMFVAGGAAAVR